MRDPSGGSNPARIIIVIVVLALIGVLGFFVWHRFMQWHEEQLSTAVEEERRQVKEELPDTREEIVRWLEENTELEPRRQQPKVSKKRMEDVFGEPVLKGEDRGCPRMERQLVSFFDYLDTKHDIGSEDKAAYEIFEEMIEDLAQTPPLVTGEARNLSNLLKNRAHFFRVLGKDRIELAIAVLRSDRDVLEHAMNNFYRYLVSEKCCKEYFGTCIPEETLYEYAAFFLDTLAGQGYLMRRDAGIRTLSLYYSLLVLDRAADQGINRHGIDIRPRIDDALNEVEATGGLRFKKRYISRLQDLKQKYRTENRR
ncbi:MAG: hypothetical protein ACQETG_02455 [Thermodesulfobacteriota bacterium]